MYTSNMARIAIARKQVADMEKSFMLTLHKQAVEEIQVYNLPYRTLIDYYKNITDRDPMEIPLNPYYPYPDIPKEYKPPVWDFEKDGGYSWAEWIGLISKHTGKVDEDGKERIVFEVPQEVQAQIDEWEAEKTKERTGKEYTHIWNLSTAAGREQWLYYFAVFLLPYEDDIPHWSTFDMFGDTKHTQQELDERKQYYMNLIAKCQEHPEAYKHEVQRKQLSDYDKYDFSDWFGYMWQDGHNAEPPHGDNALAIMYKERDITRDYEQESAKRGSRAYRIREIIEQLESEKGTPPG